MQLNKHQIDKVNSFLLNDLEVSNLNIDELSDHYCSEIEHHMSNGMNFEKSLSLIFASDKAGLIIRLDSDLKAIKRKTLMKKILVLVLLMVFAVSVYGFLNRSEKVKIENSEPIAEVLELDPPSKWPVKDNPNVSSSFGMRMHPVLKEQKFHRGIDIPAKKGTEVIASSAGVIEKAAYHKSYGYHIIIKHDNRYSSLYSQLSKMLVEPGQKVNKGKIIGEVGSSGLSTNPHLHFEVLDNGKAKNPMNFIKA